MFQNLISSILKNNPKESKISFKSLESKFSREHQVFDVMKEELQVAQNVNAHKKKNFYEGSKTNVYIKKSKRQTVKDDYRKYDEFRDILQNSKNVVVMTGPLISVDSGIPTFSGVDRIYRSIDAHTIARLDTFEKSPSLVWEFYHYQRELVLNAKPNKAHYAIAELERECNAANRNFTLITQNTDELHKVAGSHNILELHGTIFRTKCTICGDIQPNYDDPICPAFKNVSINPSHKRNETEDVPVSELPRCKKTNCNGLLRPDTVWYEEALDERITNKTEEAMEKADICIVIGSTSMVLPASEFPVTLANKGIPVAEFHQWTTLNTKYFKFHFVGEYKETVPQALRKFEDTENNDTINSA